MWKGISSIRCMQDENKDQKAECIWLEAASILSMVTNLYQEQPYKIDYVP